MEITLFVVAVALFFLFRSDNKGRISWLQKRIERLEERANSLQLELDVFKRRDVSSDEQEQKPQFAERAELPVKSELSEQTQLEQSSVWERQTSLTTPELLNPESISQPEPILQSDLASQTVQSHSQGTESPAPISSSSIQTDTLSVWEKAKSEPSKPNPIWQWLIRGNPMLKVGVVILFLGLAFLLRFASEHFSFSVEARYFSVAATGVLCGIIGWRLRHRYREYALTMQGASIAILYLTALATLKLHSLLPPLLVFGIQVALVALMIFLAVVQNAKILAQVAVLGGLASPVLISDGSGNYIGLFTYLSLLNAGVAGVAWFKSWRSLNIIGAIGTFAIAVAWGMTSYKVEYFTACQIFLIFHTALYTFIVWRFAQHKAAENQSLSIVTDNNAPLAEVMSQWLQNLWHIGILDSSLLFGVSFSAFALQSGMSYSWQDGVMWSALGFAAFYASVGYWILRTSPKLKLVSEAMLFLALVFITLAIGNGFDGWHKTTLWAIEALLIYQFGIRQRAPISRVFGLALFIGSWLLYIVYLFELENYSLINSVFFVFAGFLFYLAWALQRKAESATWEKLGATVLLVATLYLTFIIPFYEKRIGRLDILQSAVISLAILLIASVVQWWRENKVLTVFSAIGLIMTIVLYEHNFSIGFLVYLALVSGAMAWCSHKPIWVKVTLPRVQKISGYIQLIVTMFALFFTFDDVIDHFGLFDMRVDEYYQLVLTFVVIILLAHYLTWLEAGKLALCFLPIWILFSIILGLFDSINWNYLLLYLVLYGIAVLLHGLIMYWQCPYISQAFRLRLHTLGLIIFTLQFTHLATSVADKYQLSTGWQMTAFAVVPILVMALIFHFQSQIRRLQLEKSYLGIGGLLVMSALCCWAVFANIHSSAQALPLPYIPLFNPLELASFAVAYLLWQWNKANSLSIMPKNVIMAVLGSFALFMLSVIAMRVWHHYAGIEWRFENLVGSFSVQATLSVIWTISAITLMLHGHRSNERHVWFVGAGLIAVVVVKLFLVELGDSGGIARIVSFIVVGILLLLVGYFAPIPPKLQISAAEKEEITEEQAN